MALQVDNNVLDGLRRSNNTDAMKLHDVIQSWYTTQPTETTWDVIISAVKGPIVNNKRKADEIRKHLSMGGSSSTGVVPMQQYSGKNKPQL